MLLTQRRRKGRKSTFPPYRGTGIAFVGEIIKPTQKARTCTAMQHLSSSTSRRLGYYLIVITVLTYCRSLAPLLGPENFPEGFACSVTPTAACTLEGCTVEVNRGSQGRALVALRQGPGIHPRTPAERRASRSRSNLDAVAEKVAAPWTAFWAAEKSAIEWPLPSGRGGNHPNHLAPGERAVIALSGTRGGAGPVQAPAVFGRWLRDLAVAAAEPTSPPE